MRKEERESRERVELEKFKMMMDMLRTQLDKNKQSYVYCFKLPYTILNRPKLRL